MAEFVFGAGGRLFTEALDDFAGDAAAHGRAAFVDFAEGGEEFFARCLFEKVSGGSGFEGFEDAVRVFVNGDHDELDFWKLDFETADAFHAVEAGEVDVYEGDVGFVVGDGLEGFLSVAILAHKGEAVRLFDPVGVDGAERQIVFNDGDGNVVLGRAHGRDYRCCGLVWVSRVSVTR